MLPCHSPDASSFFEELSSFQGDKLLEELLANRDSPTSNVINTHDSSTAAGGANNRGRKRSVDQEIKKSGKSSKDAKKILHKEVERQRRQEMAGLFASLRSLLPLHYIKGKRATSDHMNEAVKYITEMQKKIEELRDRRDKLKSVCGSSSGGEEAANVTSNNNDSTSCVKVNVMGDEIEILISSGFTCQAFSLSKVLAQLLGRGLNVVTCVSTSFNDRSLHKIQIQAIDPTYVDLVELESTLANLIKLS